MESESRYRALFEAANDAILIRDENGVCIDCNIKALELYGCPRSRLIGSPPGFATPENQPGGGNSVARAKQVIARAMAGEPQCLEWQIRRFDGEYRDVQARVSCFTVNDRKYVQAVLRDITRQKRMEVELRQAQKMEGIGTLAGGIAHDFNNILSAIIGYTELAQMKIDQDSDLARDLGQVRKASERARGLAVQTMHLRPGLPIIICTGYSESISVEKAHELGIRTYLHKPVSLNELLAAVHEALQNT